MPIVWISSGCGLAVEVLARAACLRQTRKNKGQTGGKENDRPHRFSTGHPLCSAIWSVSLSGSYDRLVASALIMLLYLLTIDFDLFRLYHSPISTRLCLSFVSIPSGGTSWWRSSNMYIIDFWSERKSMRSLLFLAHNKPADHRMTACGLFRLVV
jgi:hypothetical protein